jgi:hypothetical protein
MFQRSAALRDTERQIAELSWQMKTQEQAEVALQEGQLLQGFATIQNQQNLFSDVLLANIIVLIILVRFRMGGRRVEFVDQVEGPSRWTQQHSNKGNSRSAHWLAGRTQSSLFSDRRTAF